MGPGLHVSGTTGPSRCHIAAWRWRGLDSRLRVRPGDSRPCEGTKHRGGSRSGRVPVTTARGILAPSAPVAAALAGPAVAEADTGPAPAVGDADVLLAEGRSTAWRQR